MELLWQVLDQQTMLEAKRDGIDESGTYEVLCKRIQERLMLLHPGHVSLTRASGDVVMGISQVEEGAQEYQEPPMPAPAKAPTGQSQDQPLTGDLDAIKGKGKGKGDPNKCLRCGGDGHYSWACPTARDSIDTRGCHGCNGKGHLKPQCPIADPSLKGRGKGFSKGKGYSKGFSKGGNGKCYGKGGGNKGGKGGFYSFDFMWDGGQAQDDWGQWDGNWGQSGNDNSWPSLRGIGSLSEAAPMDCTTPN